MSRLCDFGPTLAAEYLAKEGLEIDPETLRRFGRWWGGIALATGTWNWDNLRRTVAEADVFSRQSDSTTIAAQYAQEGFSLKPANMDRVNYLVATKSRTVAQRKLRGL